MPYAVKLVALLDMPDAVIKGGVVTDPVTGKQDDKGASVNSTLSDSYRALETA